MASLNLIPLGKPDKEKIQKLRTILDKIKMPTKMVIVMRKDLNMRKGKIAAQSAHACVNAVLRLLFKYLDKDSFEQKDSTYQLPQAFCEDNFKDWILGNYTKICVYVNSERELDNLFDKAYERGLNVVKVIDKGFTEFNGVPTKTCIAIGPDYANKIDEITKNLPLF